MFRVITIIFGFVIATVQASAVNFDQCHGGPGCGQGDIAPALVYDCYGSGAEQPDLILTKESVDLTDGVVSMIGNNKFMRNAFNEFREFGLAGITGALGNIDFYSEEALCNSQDNCVRLSKAALRPTDAEFVLRIGGSAHGAVSYKCTIRENKN